MNPTYTVVLKNADGVLFVRAVHSKDKDGVSADTRAIDAVKAMAGTGYVLQQVTLMQVDLDLTTP